MGVVGRSFLWPDSGVVGHASWFGYWELPVTPSGGLVVGLSAMLPSFGITSCLSLLLVWVLGVVGHSFWWPDSGVVGHASRFGYWELSAIPSDGRIVELSAMPPGLDIGCCRPLFLVVG